jgi:hypothetical protein
VYCQEARIMDDVAKLAELAGQLRLLRQIEGDARGQEMPGLARLIGLTLADIDEKAANIAAAALVGK